MYVMEARMSDDATQAGAVETPKLQDRSRGRDLKERVIEEFKRFWLMAIYLWAVFSLFVLNEDVVMRSQGINFVANGFAIVNALVLAKVMLIAQNMNLRRWAPQSRLIYRIVFETLLVVVLFVCFHVIERVVVGLIKGQAVGTSLPSFGGGGMLGLLCVALSLFVSLMPYFAFRNIGRALGPGQMKALLFESRKNVASGGARTIVRGGAGQHLEA
jgi:hypothetical protein